MALQGVRQGLKALLQAPRLPAEEGLLHPGVFQEAVEPGGEEASFLVEEGRPWPWWISYPSTRRPLKPPPVPGKPPKPHPPPLHRLLPRHPHPVGEEAEAGEVAPFLHPFLVQEGFGKHLRPSADGEDGLARLQVPLDQGEEGPKPGEVPRREAASREDEKPGPFRLLGAMGVDHLGELGEGPELVQVGGVGVAEEGHLGAIPGGLAVAEPVLLGEGEGKEGEGAEDGEAGPVPEERVGGLQELQVPPELVEGEAYEPLSVLPRRAQVP